MVVSIFYILLAMLGLSFLIFIHELGHYFMARRVGMRAETFSIGFGKPIVSWKRHGVRWQIGWLLFGGYVKIAGMDEEKQDPYTIPDGFFGKTPWDRIKVAFAGPCVNLVFAFLAFGALWVLGGREKSFSEFTTKIGWVDPHSVIYAEGVRPGDEITAYNGYAYSNVKDHLYAPMTSEEQLGVEGYRVDYATGEKNPFQLTVKPYTHPAAMEKDVKTGGILQSASYIIYAKQTDGSENPLPEGSPLQDSGIQYGDRIVWVDGELIFSVTQLNHLLNDERALLTVKRGAQTLLRRAPRILVQELRLDPSFREELIDWQFEALLNSVKLQNLYTIPYNLSNEGVVEERLKFIDPENQNIGFPQYLPSAVDEPLEPGDQIIAIDGTPVQKAWQILAELQHNRVNIIVERDPRMNHAIESKEADLDFDREVAWNDVQRIVQTIGSIHPVTSSGDLFLLKPVTPKVRGEFPLSSEKQALYATEILERRKQIEGIEDPERRTKLLHLFEEAEKQQLIGLPNIQDRRVIYNPDPVEQFANVVDEIWRTLTALVSGTLNPKWMSGPIGIVQVVQQHTMLSWLEAIFWLGAISLNLGILNLLPIPVLDGGTILLSLYEMVTGRRIKAKTMERLVFPFAVLLILFFIFLTYNDLSRLLKHFVM